MSNLTTGHTPSHPGGRGASSMHMSIFYWYVVSVIVWPCTKLPHTQQRKEPVVHWEPGVELSALHDQHAHTI